MNVKGAIHAVMDAVKQKLEEFCQKAPTGEDLSPELLREFNHGLRIAFAKAGRVGVKTLLESSDATTPHIMVEGRKMILKGKSAKELLTPFGTERVERRIYQARDGGECFAPIDAKACLIDDFATPDAADVVLFAAGLIPPRNAEELLGKCAMFNPSTTAIRTMIEKYGKRVEGADSQLRREVFSECVPSSDKIAVLAASMDGANVRLDEAGPKRGRPAERPRGDGGSEADTCFKNAMVTSISFYGEACLSKEGHLESERLAGRYLARMPEERAVTFHQRTDEALDILEQFLPEGGAKILLLDGAKGLWARAGENKRFAAYEWLIDFFHTTEHLSKASEALFGKNSSTGRKWYEKWRKLLLEDKRAAAGVVRSMDHHVRTLRMGKSRLKDLATEKTFFVRNKKLMRYAEFLQKGWPIGSGPVEAACKSIVKARLCASGMCWSRKGGQHVLTIRSYIKSGLWNEFYGRYLEMRQKQTPEFHELAA